DAAGGRDRAGAEGAGREGRGAAAVQAEAIVLYRHVLGAVADLKPRSSGVVEGVAEDHLAAGAPAVLPPDLRKMHEGVPRHRGVGVVLVPEASESHVVTGVVADDVVVVRVGATPGEADPERELVLREVRIEADLVRVERVVVGASDGRAAEQNAPATAGIAVVEGGVRDH